MAEPTVKSLREVRAEQIGKSVTQQQRELRMQRIAQVGKVRREASRMARRRDLPGYGRAFDVRVVKERKGIEKSIGEAFAAKEKEIEVAARKAIRESDVTGDVVTLLNGEYVDKVWFDELSQPKKDFLLEQGLSRYKQEYLAELRTDEYVDKEWFASLNSDEQGELKEKGLQASEYNYFDKVGEDKGLMPKRVAESVVSPDFAKWLLSQELSQPEVSGLSTSGLFASSAPALEAFRTMMKENASPKDYEEFLAAYNVHADRYLEALRGAEEGMKAWEARNPGAVTPTAAWRVLAPFTEDGGWTLINQWIDAAANKYSAKYVDKFKELGQTGYNDWFKAELAKFGYRTIGTGEIIPTEKLGTPFVIKTRENADLMLNYLGSALVSIEPEIASSPSWFMVGAFDKLGKPFAYWRVGGIQAPKNLDENKVFPTLAKIAADKGEVEGRKWLFGLGFPVAKSYKEMWDWAYGKSGNEKGWLSTDAGKEFVKQHLTEPVPAKETQGNGKQQTPTITTREGERTLTTREGERTLLDMLKG